jgi:hypothetical protein
MGGGVPEPEPGVGEVSSNDFVPPISLEGIDWMALMPLVDWVELEAQTSGDPGEFAQTVYARCYQDGSEPHALLRDVFLNHSPQAVISTFADLGQTLQKPWVISMARFAGKTSDIEAAQRIIARLTDTPEGHHWVAEAVVAMGIIEERLLEIEEGAGSDSSTVAGVPDEPEPEPEAGISLVHPGLHDVLSDADDDDDDDDEKMW